MGVAFYTGRGDKLLSGWNTMNEQERAVWNRDALFRSSGIFCIVTGIFLLAVFFFAFFTPPAISDRARLGIILAVLTFYLLGVAKWLRYVNKNAKFKAGSPPDKTMAGK
jgi:hypothetical protein